jgi:hypothetical protein
VGLISAVQFLSGEYATTTLEPGLERLPYGATSAWLSIMMQTTFFFPLLFLLLLFPTGRLLSSRWRIVGWAGASAVSLVIASTALRPGPLADFTYFNNPFGVDAAAILSLIDVGAVWLLIVTLLGAVFSLIVRFVRARREERQQIKWFAAAAMLGFFTLFFISILSSELGGLENWIWAIVPASLPIAVGIAVLRYRLYDIDFIINRALVYGSMTVTLAALYFGSIVLLQRLFVLLTGERSTLAIVASTLLIAALFNPLRRRLQSFIDRRFYRSKYDAAKTLEAFSARLREETDLHRLSEDLMGVIKETMQPAHVSLWLHADPALKDKKMKRAAIRESRHDEQ